MAGLDGLGGYLGAHILDQLDANDREFLISTAVLQEVSVESAVALGIDDAAGRLASLRPAAIPAQWSADPLTLRCHSRFREYLRGLLDQRGNAAVRELRAAHGRLLARRGFHEEAVEELLAAGALTDAYTSAKLRSSVSSTVWTSPSPIAGSRRYRPLCRSATSGSPKPS